MSDDARLRLALVGCGRAALVQYTPAVRYLQHGTVTALCDPDPTAVERLRRYHPQAEAFHDYDELLASDTVDAVIILTPTRMHADQVIKAARAGKHVLCEKPLAGTLGECDQMIDACEAGRVIFMSAFMKRFDKSMRHAKRAIESGSLGDVHTVTCDWRGIPTPVGVSDDAPAAPPAAPPPGWRMQLGQGGGLLADLGAHTADLTRWWLGDIAVVSGEFAIAGPHAVVDNQACAVYVHEGGARSIHLFGATQERWHESYQVDGTEGTLIVKFAPGASHGTTEPFQITRFTRAGAEISDETLYPDWSMDVELELHGRYARQVEHFCESALSGQAPIVTGEDGRKATEAVNAAYLSSFTERKVRLPLEDPVDLDAMFSELAQARQGSPVAVRS